MGKLDIYKRLHRKHTDQPWRIYRAVIHSVNVDEETGERTIYIKEYGTIDEPPYTVAMPPSFAPIDSMGSGVCSVPIPESECLVIEGGIGHHQMSRAQILTYLPFRGVHNEGTLSSVEQLDDGDFMFKVGGRQKTTFKMTKSGKINLFSGNFAQVDINGDLKKIEIQSKRYLRKNSVGLYLNEWIEPTLMNPLILERTSHTSSFYQKPESPLDSDTKLDTEQVNLKPNFAPYVNKAVVRAGKIPNTLQMLQDSSTHTYQIDTRNSTMMPFMKDSVTKLEVGYQGGHYPYGGKLFWRAPGNMIHWTAKRNVAGNVGTFLWRYGQLDGWHGTKAPIAPGISAIPEEDLKGETWRRQIHQGLQFNVPFGVPVIDPVGEGKGYLESDMGTTNQTFVESLGKLSGISPTMLVDPTRGSIWRRYLHDQAVPGTGLFVEEKYGGQGIAMGVEPDYYTRDISTKLATAPQDTFIERWGKSLALGGHIYTIEVKDNITQATNTFSMSPLETKLENNFLPTLAKSSLVFDHGAAMSATLMHQLAAFMGSIEITSTAITINSNNGLGQIKIDTTNPAAPDITLTAGALNVTINPTTGFQVGGNSCAMASLVDWILSNASAFGIGNMGAPVPIFPGAIVPLSIEANLTASTIMGGATTGMKSGV